MKDPFDILRAELVSAAERAALPALRKRWGWLRRPRARWLSCWSRW